MLNKEKYAITFACYNSVEYTKKCIDSMIKHGTPLDRLVVVDNASSDGTLEYLKSLPIGKLILNKSNLGCGVAWNQGALHFQSEWTIIMNNDVLVSANWIEKLIRVAEENQLKIACPSLIEGELDYDFDEFSKEASQKLINTIRVNSKHAVCMAIHNSVWTEIGYFLPNPRLLGYEDTIFFDAAIRKSIKTGIVGASWLHHFGSITQTAMKLEKGLNNSKGLGDRKNYKLLNKSWLRRKIEKFIKIYKITQSSKAELAKFGITVHGKRKNGHFIWL